jgi:peptidoglycan/xylan/chitin deacetylase (PgdA/CDA1 family)
MELLAINYHYIDDPAKYKAGIYPVSPEELALQIDTLKKEYTFVSGAQLVDAVRGKSGLPERSCILTFDDALKSQYINALPVLEEKNVPAIFFFLTGHLKNGKVYTLHKIHHLLSQHEGAVLLEQTLFLLEKKHNTKINWQEIGVEKISGWYRYDNEPTAKFKYALNHFLEDETSVLVVDQLFNDMTTTPEQELADTLYLSQEEMTTLAHHPRAAVGMHTHTHINIMKCDKETVRQDITTNAEILSEEIGVKPLEIISYPFGMITKEVFEKKVKSVADEIGLVCGFSIEKKIDINLDEPFLLGRFNPIDRFPR